jgi:hypothetical protein
MTSQENIVIFQGNYSQDQVSIDEVESTRLINEDLESKCKDRWNESLQQAATEGKQIWDSTVYRYENSLVKEDSLELNLSTIPFSMRWSMNSFTADIATLGLEYAARGMYTSCFVITHDNKYVFIEDAGKHLNRRKYMFVGGTLSKTEKELDTGEDLFNEARKECIEEAGAKPADINSVVLNAGYITNSYSVCLIFTVTLNITFNELVERFNESNDGEAKGLIGVEKEELRKFALGLDVKEHVKFRLLGLI